MGLEDTDVSPFHVSPKDWNNTWLRQTDKWIELLQWNIIIYFLRLAGSTLLNTCSYYLSVLPSCWHWWNDILLSQHVALIFLCSLRKSYLSYMFGEVRDTPEMGKQGIQNNLHSTHFWHSVCLMAATWNIQGVGPRFASAAVCFLICISTDRSRPAPPQACFRQHFYR